MNQPNQQNPNRPQQQEQKPTPPRVQPENMIVLLAGDEKSNPRLRNAAVAKYPQAQIMERVADARLSNTNAVVVVIDTLKVSWEGAEDGADDDGSGKETVKRGIRFTEPVYVADHWTQNVGGDWSAKVNSFLNALAPQCIPKQINSRSRTEGFIRVSDV